MTEALSQRQSLRNQFRDKRRQLSEVQQHKAAEHILQRCQHAKLLRKGQTVALYLANDGEVGTQALIEHCWQKGIKVCLPVIHPFSPGNLLFQRFTPNTLMVDNQYRIREPKLSCPDVVPTRQLSAVFTPLVAFDSTGNRLGMGGGYYDRTLGACLRSRGAPRFVGLAHDCQQADELPTENWDVPLSAIVTPSRVFTGR